MRAIRQHNHRDRLAAQRLTGSGTIFRTMTDPVEEILVPHVVERAMTIYESFSDRQHADIVQARKALTRHVYGLICSGETSSQRLTVSGLAHLKQLEKERQVG
jgi:hypothetical protein